MCLGTPRYAAPEALRGEVLDARVDVYAAGVLLHFLLTRVGPFPGVQGSGEWLRAHATRDPIAPSAVVASIPAALDHVVLRAMAKVPSERFATAREFIAALDAAARPGLARVPRIRSTLAAAGGFPWLGRARSGA